MLATATFAQQGINSRIVFLKIIITDTSATLQSAAIRPGKLKSLHKWPQVEELTVHVLGVSGDSLWEGRQAFPLARKIEFVDASGNLQTKLEKLSSTEIVVRTPYFENMRFVEFHKVENAIAAVQNAANANKLARKKLLGRFKIEDFVVKED